MSAQPLARLAGLLADPTRAAMCLALLDGRAWTAGELAHHVGVVASTASEQLSRLVAGGLLVEERQGRHRYVRLAGPGTATLVEDLAAFAQTQPGSSATAAPAPRNLRESVRRSAEAHARTCYDHLAGRVGVAVADSLLARGVVSDDAGLAVTVPGRAWLAGLGIDVEGARHGRRPLVRSCLDWTERRPHLAGVLGSALRSHAMDARWLEPVGTGRALRVTADGAEALRDLFGISLDRVRS
ncbi:ArsR/SmtB family transcription factor [Streptacidiphilus neutrinimicus]|uniref:ArsR/SmtB family transcription factor n=1 Tax=Streptacidiphilus neutrinimicus TaxID=105420 RepID=UPI0005A9D6A0|nr:winged helix-turn-helix domain-containing protein [Streptacidiphilus neutrinimicus]